MASKAPIQADSPSPPIQICLLGTQTCEGMVYVWYKHGPCIEEIGISMG